MGGGGGAGHLREARRYRELIPTFSLLQKSPEDKRKVTDGISERKAASQLFSPRCQPLNLL